MERRRRNSNFSRQMGAVTHNANDAQNLQSTTRIIDYMAAYLTVFRCNNEGRRGRRETQRAESGAEIHFIKQQAKKPKFM